MTNIKYVYQNSKLVLRPSPREDLIINDQTRDGKKQSNSMDENILGIALCRHYSSEQLRRMKRFSKIKEIPNLPKVDKKFFKHVKDHKIKRVFKNQYYCKEVSCR